MALSYVRLHAAAVPVRSNRTPPILGRRDYAEVAPRVGAVESPPPDAVVVGVPVVGLCIVHPDERRIEAPLILPEARDVDAYASLLLHACALLGPGEATLEAWETPADVIEAYEDLGFDVVERR